MNLDFLITYLDVVKLGSYSKAAKKLSYSQPNVSLQIRKLEKEIGLRLVDYRSKTVHTTEAGRRLFRFAELVCHEHSNLLREFNQLREKLTGNLFVISSDTIGEYILPTLASEFKKRYPAIGINISISGSPKAIEEVATGTFEVGFCNCVPDDRSLESFKIGEDEIVLVVYPGHKLSHQTDVSLEELESELFILRSETIDKAYGAADLLLKVGFDLKQFSSRLILGSNSGVISAVQAQAGIAFISNLAVKQSETLGIVKTLKIKNTNLKRNLMCIYSNERSQSPICMEFIGLIRDQVGFA